MAIESFSLKTDKNPLSHGESIAIGIVCESYLSYRENLLGKQELEEIVRLCYHNIILYDQSLIR